MGQDQIYRTRLQTEGRTRRERTQAERAALWASSKIVDVDKTGRASPVQKNPMDSFAAQFQERYQAGRNPVQEHQNETWEVNRTRGQKVHLQRRRVEAMVQSADLITQHIMGPEHMVMRTMTPSESVPIIFQVVRCGASPRGCQALRQYHSALSLNFPFPHQD